MRRRQLLRNFGTAGLAAAAGCLGSGDPGDGPDDGGSTGTDTPTPGVTGTDFEVTGVESGSTEQSAGVAFDGDVTVTGTTTGRNGCYTAVLEAVAYDHPELVVTVRAEEQGGAGGCTQALVEIDYEATVATAGPGPDTVVVEHDSMGETTTVTTATRPE
jgi:hypothetical protein